MINFIGNQIQEVNVLNRKQHLRVLSRDIENNVQYYTVEFVDNGNKFTGTIEVLGWLLRDEISISLA